MKLQQFIYILIRREIDSQIMLLGASIALFAVRYMYLEGGLS